MSGEAIKTFVNWMETNCVVGGSTTAHDAAEILVTTVKADVGRAIASDLNRALHYHTGSIRKGLRPKEVLTVEQVLKIVERHSGVSLDDILVVEGGTGHGI